MQYTKNKTADVKKENPPHAVLASGNMQMNSNYPNH